MQATKTTNTYSNHITDWKGKIEGYRQQIKGKLQPCVIRLYFLVLYIYIYSLKLYKYYIYTCKKREKYNNNDKCIQISNKTFKWITKNKNKTIQNIKTTKGMSMKNDSNILKLKKIPIKT